MVGAAHSSVSARTAAREAYFLDFAETIRRRFPDLILLVTGGFRTRKGMQSALDHDACDLIGIGRPACVDPALPKKLLDKKLPDEEAQLVLRNVPSNFISRWSPVKVMGAGLEMVSFRISQREDGLELESQGGKEGDEDDDC